MTKQKKIALGVAGRILHAPLLACRRGLLPCALFASLAINHTALQAQVPSPQLVVGAMPSYAQLIATYPEGLKEDSKYVLLAVPDLASSGAFKVKLVSELPATTLMALYVGPSLVGTDWSPVGLFQIGPRLSAVLEMRMRNERTQSYMLVVVANDKHYKVVREVKHVLDKPADNPPKPKK